MKHTRKLTAAALSVLLVNSLTIQVFAQTAPSAKEEVIYVMTDASGKVTDIEAVNIFAGGDITDYGDYSAVKPLNTTDTIVLNGNTVTFSSDAAKVYYQGTMKSTVIPWDISIRYFLDGKEYSAENIAGKSGALEIHLSIGKNESCKTGFYENYALQASFTLDTELCKNITSDGATVANVGSDKQLTYTILPDKGIDTVIKADVTDFEMDAVSINGVRLNMDIEIDEDALTDKVDELVSAIGSLDDGASELYDGASSLRDGASELHDGTGELYDATTTLNDKFGELNTGVGILTDGASDLSAGLSEITSKNDTLTDAAYAAYEGLCSAAGAALNNALSQYGLGTVSLTPSTYAAVLTGLLEQLDSDTIYRAACETAKQQVTQQVNEQADALYLGYIQSQGDSVYLAYVTSQADLLYAQAAAQAVCGQLMQNGYSEAEANAFLQTAEGQAAVAQAAASLTEDQKAQILSGAVSQLTEEQKNQILQGTVQSLTDEQKSQIREAYIQQLMTSDEVTSQINAAVSAGSSAAGQITSLKGQLDNYGAFYRGLAEYTRSVSEASSGAASLKVNMDTLHSNTGTLQTAVGDLNDAVRKLYDGTGELADGTSELMDGTSKLSDGTSELADKTSDIDTQISDEIDSMTSTVFGSGEEVVSFVSDRNTNVSSVQFVIKTAAIEMPEAVQTEAAEEAPLTFWQKLLRLFGI